MTQRHRNPAIVPLNDQNANPGLPWPEAYADILPVLREQWGIIDTIYLTRQLSGGKSGALVYMADIESRTFTGQAILKLEQAANAARREDIEAELHRHAIEEAPEFAAAHLPRLLHSLCHGDQVAVLSTIAGGGLEYAEPLAGCAFDRQLTVIREVSRGLLEDWNADYRLGKGMRSPRELLASWLAYRLDPNAGGRLHRFMEECALSPETPSVVFEGRWLPNPMALATASPGLPEQSQLRAITGHCHGDLHGYNILTGQAVADKPSYYLIDLAMYESRQFLFYDHAYFEMSVLLTARGDASQADWNSILAQLGDFDHGEEDLPLRTDDLGLIELVHALRGEVNEWIARNESNRRSFMENQYLLARVAAGLNFTHKRISLESRQMAFLYAALNLKDYCKLNRLNWPKDGPSFAIGSADRSAVQSTASVAGSSGGQSAAATSSAVPPAIEPVAPPQQPAPAIGTFFSEVRRRHVIRVAGAYLVVAWLCIQAINAFGATLGLPSSAGTFATVALAIGFPIACFIAWVIGRRSGGRGGAQEDSGQGAGGRSAGSVVDYIALGGIVVVIGLTVADRLDHPEDVAPTVTADEVKSIAVLPFRNLNSDTDDDHFSEGLTIEIMNRLAQTGAFRIAGRTSTFRYGSEPDDLRAIGAALDVEYILEGSVRRFRDQLRIEAQLVQANDGFLIWSDIYDDEMRDIFAIQQEMAKAIGTALKTPLGIAAAEREIELTDNPQVYDLYLNGIALLEQRGPGLEEAAALLEESLEIEPTFAAGWAALSLVYGLIPIFIEEIDGRPVIASAYYRRAADAALRADSLDPGLPIVLHAIGNTYQRNRQWRAAEDKYRAALDAEPDSPRIMQDYVQLLAVAGYLAEASAMAEALLESDPLNPLSGLIEAVYRWAVDPDEESVRGLESAFEEHPGLRQIAARVIIGYRFEHGEVEEIRQFLDDCGSCAASWRDRAVAMIDATDTDPPEEVFETNKDEVFAGYTFWNAIGGVDLLMQAFQYHSLETNRRPPVFSVPWNLIDTIGHLDRFKEIVKDMGLVDYWRQRGWPEFCRPHDNNDFDCGRGAS
ncbi:MAG: hypothetical protein GY798_19675 [Hyphomicrobiales bacterium]|nr:hypothetical protein [Hyphomicrobiales bacterium]